MDRHEPCQGCLVQGVCEYDIDCIDILNAYAQVGPVLLMDPASGSLTCSECGEARSQSHSWHECMKRIRAAHADAMQETAALARGRGAVWAFGSAATIMEGIVNRSGPGWASQAVEAFIACSMRFRALNKQTLRIPTCAACDDTRKVTRNGRKEACMTCPVPCDACADGTYCKTPACGCDCHG